MPESELRSALPFTRKLLIIITLVLSIGTILHLCVLPASSAARPVIDTDSPVYSHLTREVLISGYGLQASLTYFLWLQKPRGQNASFTGVSFVATTTGGVPYPNVKIPLDVPPALGTYVLTISTSSALDTAGAMCHFGVVGPVKPVYQRREVAKFVGGGVLPGSTIRLDIRNPMDALVSNATAIANDMGEFEHTWPIPNNVQVGSWIISVGGTGTFDNGFERHRADGQFGVIEASLRLSVHQQPLARYQRTETAKIAFIVKYPDESPVTTIKPGSKPVFISRMGIITQSLPLVLADAMNGIWVAEYIIARNDTLAKNYTLLVSPGSFDDGFGNKAPSSTSVSSQFEVAPAQLRISILSPKDTYEILFDSVILNVTAKYPDGSDLVDGKVSATFESGTLRDSKPLVFQEKSRCWILTYYLAITEIQRIGTWKMTLLAEDSYGNNGVTSMDISVRVLWLFVAVATSGVLTIIILKWASEETGLRRLLKKKDVKQKAS